MTMPKRWFFLPLAALLGLGMGSPLFGQDQKGEEKGDQGKSKGKVVTFKSEFKFHPVEMNAGQNYMVVVKARFSPRVQIRNKENTRQYYYRSGGSRVGKHYINSFTYTPATSDTYNILVFTSSPPLGKGALDYTVQVHSFEPMFKAQDKLTNADPKYPLRNGCYHKVHKVKLEKGKSYQIDLVGPFDPYLYLEDPRGNVLRSNDDGGSGLNSRIMYVPQETDEYRVIVTSCGGGATGAYTLSVSETPGNIGIGKVGIGPGRVIINPGFKRPVQVPQRVPNPPAKKQIKKIRVPFQGQPKVQIKINGRPIQIQPVIPQGPGGIQNPGNGPNNQGRIQIQPLPADPAAPADRPAPKKENE